MKSLILVCDDVGVSASVDRGVRALAEQTQMPLSAEYMIEQEGAVDRAKAIAEIANISRGLHFELFSISDADRVAYGKRLLEQNEYLGDVEEIREQGTKDAIRQIAIFRDQLGIEPAHISTHGNFNTNAKGEVLPWWHELMKDMFGENVPPMQLDIPHVRHNLYKWNTKKHERAPRTPDEFKQELLAHANADALEFVMHPALPQAGDRSLNMLFTAEMRKIDLTSAIAIIQSGVIEDAGFRIVPVSTLAKTKTA